MPFGDTWHEGRVIRHHNLVSATQPPITGPVDKGKGKSNTAGKGKGGPKGATVANLLVLSRTTAFTGSPTEFSNLIEGDTNWFDAGASATLVNIPDQFDYFRTTVWCDGAQKRLQRLRTSANGSYRGIGIGVTAAVNGYSGAVSAIIARADVAALRHYEETGATGADGFWAQVEGISTLNPTALVYKSGNQALSTGAWDTLTWDSEVRDSDNFHDNVTNNSRLTIPAAYNNRPMRLVLSARITDGTTASQQNALRMQRSGGDFPGMGYITKENGGTDGNYYNAVSAIIPATTGQYFEAGVFTSVASRNCLTDDATFFEIEVLPATTKYVTLVQTTNFSAAANTPTPVPFGAGSTVSDDLNTHSEVTDNTKIFVPAGVSRARARFNIEGDGNITDGSAVLSVSNNNPGPSLPIYVSTVNTGNDAVNGSSSWFDVIEGAEIVLNVIFNGGITVTAKNKNWISVEFA